MWIVHFFRQFPPRHKYELESTIEARHFTGECKSPLSVMLALLINMVRPVKRMGYQGVINRFFIDTRAATGELPASKPPDQAAFQKAGRNSPWVSSRAFKGRQWPVAPYLAARFDSPKWRGFNLLAQTAPGRTWLGQRNWRSSLASPKGFRDPRWSTARSLPMSRSNEYGKKIGR